MYSLTFIAYLDNSISLDENLPEFYVAKGCALANMVSYKFID